jgi:hypothetical protein
MGTSDERGLVTVLRCFRTSGPGTWWCCCFRDERCPVPVCCCHLSLCTPRCQFDRFAAAARDGFDAVEQSFPYEHAASDTSARRTTVRRRHCSTCHIAGWRARYCLPPWPRGQNLPPRPTGLPSILSHRLPARMLWPG